MKPLQKLALILSALLVLGLIIAWMAGAFTKKLPTELLEPASLAPPAGLYTVQITREQVFEQATGTIGARNETMISSRIIANIREVRVRAGDSVKSGQIIITLDDRDLRARVDQILQMVSTAESALNETRLDYDRIKALYERKVAARAEYDRVEAVLAGKQSELERNRRSLDEARTLLSHSIIKSPIDGKIIERLAEPGNTATPGLPLIRIYNPKLLWLNANVRESLTAGLSIGDQLYASIDAIGKPLPVHLDEIVPAADPGTRSVTVKALLPQEETLYPGMFGRLLIPSGEVERIYIPAAAIKRIGQLEYVTIFKDHQTSRRFIRSGQQAAQGLIEIVSGLAPGEIIVSE